MTKTRTLLVAALLAAMMVTGIQPASASPYTTISSSGPLQNIDIGDDLSCQVEHVNDALFQFYSPTSQPGDCGTMLVVGGNLYAPDFGSHPTATGGLGSYVTFTPVTQTGVTGSGTVFSPYEIVTTVNVGTTGLQIVETDEYVVGDDHYTTHVEIRNLGLTAQNFILYRAGDCYLGGSDIGYGAVNVNVAGAVGCTENPHNSPPGRYINWEPLTPGSKYYHNSYNSVWSWIGGKTAFPNTCACPSYLDNGAGLSWSGAVNGGSSMVYSHHTRFSVPEGSDPECDARETQCVEPPPPLTPGARCEADAIKVVHSSTQVQDMESHKSRSRAGVLAQPGMPMSASSPPTPPVAPKAQSDADDDGVTIVTPQVTLRASKVSSRCDVDAVFNGGGIFTHAYGRGSIEDLEVRVGTTTIKFEALDFELEARGQTPITKAHHACDIVELDTLTGSPKEVGVCSLGLASPTTVAGPGVSVEIGAPWTNAPVLDPLGDWMYEGALAKITVKTSAPHPPSTTTFYLDYVKLSVTGGPAMPSMYVPNTGCTVACT